jgi:hypothetical protein
LAWKKEDRNCIKLLVRDISIVLLWGRTFAFFEPKNYYFQTYKGILWKKWPYFAIFWKLIN